LLGGCVVMLVSTIINRGHYLAFFK